LPTIRSKESSCQQLLFNLTACDKITRFQTFCSDDDVAKLLMKGSTQTAVAEVEGAKKKSKIATKAARPVSWAAAYPTAELLSSR